MATRRVCGQDTPREVVEVEGQLPDAPQARDIIAKELGVLAGLDVHKFAEGMLDAKAQIDHLSMPVKKVAPDESESNFGKARMFIWLK